MQPITMIEKVKSPRPIKRSMVTSAQDKINHDLSGYRLSFKSQKLIKRMSSFIDDTWTKIKKGKTFLSEPKFITNTKEGGIVRVRSVDNGRHHILMEIESDDFIETIMLDREKADHFKYEKYKITPHGCAMVKSYSNKSPYNELYNEIVNSRIENLFPKILPTPRFGDVFSRL